MSPEFPSNVPQDLEVPDTVTVHEADGSVRQEVQGFGPFQNPEDAFEALNGSDDEDHIVRGEE